MNNTWVLMQGQNGVSRRGRISDAEGRVALDQFDSVHLLAAKNSNSDPVIDMKTCTIDADQSSEASETEGKGWFTYTTDADDALIPSGTYVMNIVCVDGSTRHFFPLNKRAEMTYGKLIIQKALD